MRYDYAGVIDLYAASKQTYALEADRINAEVQKIREQRSTLDARLTELRARDVGIDKAIEAINRRLKNLGVKSFQIKKEEGEQSLYCLERPGVGVDVYNTLSEGEKTLITFFYFVELVGGSLDEAESFAHDKKIVVIDDPISSLSHNYVYDIASVIAHEIVNGEFESKKIRQVLVLTHSLFFFHELQKQIKPITKGCQYFRVVKKDHSAVFQMNGDAIKNEYTAFWQVIKDARDGTTNTVSVPNAMRCILEHFFSFTQQRDSFENALKELESEDFTFVPLARYLNRKSHADEVNLTDFTDHDAGYYIGKLKSVFEKTKYPEHYALMMGEERVENEEAAAA
jgi:wobble nucleotide-excising tRNase